jgi:hypothetical protein
MRPLLSPTVTNRAHAPRWEREVRESLERESKKEFHLEKKKRRKIRIIFIIYKNSERK